MNSILQRNDIIGSYKVQFFLKKGTYAENYRVKDKEGQLKFLKLFCLSKLHHSQFTSEGEVLEIEIAQQLNDYRKIVLISSVKTQYELPKKMLLARYTNLHKLLPTRTISDLEFWKRFSFSELMTKRIALYEKYIGMRSPAYLDWSIDRIVNWQQKEPLPHTVHIHGDKDPVFPIQYIKNAIVVKNGTHIMIINRYKWFNENLLNILQSN